MDATLPAPGDRVPELGGFRQAFVGHARRLHECVGRGRHVPLGYVDAPGAQYDAFVEGCAALDALPRELASAVLIAAPGCEVPPSEQMTMHHGCGKRIQYRVSRPRRHGMGRAA